MNPQDRGALDSLCSLLIEPDVPHDSPEGS